MQNCLLKNKPGSLGQTKRSCVGREARVVKKQEAAAAVALTSLLSLFHDTRDKKRAHEPPRKKVVPSLNINSNFISKCGNGVGGR